MSQAKGQSMKGTQGRKKHLDIYASLPGDRVHEGSTDTVHTSDQPSTETNLHLTGTLSKSARRADEMNVTGTKDKSVPRTDEKRESGPIDSKFKFSREGF